MHGLPLAESMRYGAQDAKILTAIYHMEVEADNKLINGNKKLDPASLSTVLVSNRINYCLNYEKHNKKFVPASQESINELNDILNGIK